MTAVHHVPGDGTALVGPRAVLLLDGVPEVEGLWPLVRDGADLDALLAALLEQGLRALGSFALLHDDRLVLRGTATAEDAAGEALSAGGAATWAEHPVPGEVALAQQRRAWPSGPPAPCRRRSRTARPCRSPCRTPRRRHRCPRSR